MKVLIIGAGVTGCFAAARLMHKGVDVSVLARGDKATRLEHEGLRMRDGMTGEKATVRLNIVRAPVVEAFDVAMVCVQAQHRPLLAPLLRELPGRPTVWYLGNTTQGYDDATEQLGRARVLGGFPGVGGTWEGETLVYADREKPDDKPFDRLIIGGRYDHAVLGINHAAHLDPFQGSFQKFYSTNAARTHGPQGRMITKPGNHDAQLFRGLDYLGPGYNFYFTIVDDYFGHGWSVVYCHSLPVT